MRNAWFYSIAALIGLNAGVRAGDDGLILLPSEVKLSTLESTQQLLLQEKMGGEISQRATGVIEWSSSDPKVVTVTDGLVKPEGDGEAIVSAKVGGQIASAK